MMVSHCPSTIFSLVFFLFFLFLLSFVLFPLSFVLCPLSFVLCPLSFVLFRTHLRLCGDEKDARSTVLLGRERVAGMTVASVVPGKGTSGQFAAVKVLDFIMESGAAAADIVFKTAQGPAIEALMANVVKTRRAVITVLEKSPVGSRGSNGVVERGVSERRRLDQDTLLGLRRDAGHKNQVRRKDDGFRG